jgi:asparagine synthetase B (glutamine-hydrolysing)
MCGIFGYVTNKEEALGPILIAAAERLTYRGDAWTAGDYTVALGDVW